MNNQKSYQKGNVGDKRSAGVERAALLSTLVTNWSNLGDAVGEGFWG